MWEGRARDVRGERAECGRQLEVMETEGLQGIESPLFLLKLLCLLSRFGQGIFSDVTFQN